MPSLTRITIGARIDALSKRAGENEAKQREALAILEEERKKARDNHRDYVELMRRYEARAQTMLESVELIVNSRFNSAAVKKDTAAKGLKAIQRLRGALVEYDRRYPGYQEEWRGFGTRFKEQLESLGVASVYEELQAQRAEEIAAIKEVRSVIEKFDALERRATGWILDAQRRADPARDASELVDKLEGHFVRMHNEKHALDQAYSSLKDKIRKFDGMAAVKKSLADIRQKRKVQKPFFNGIDAVYREVSAQFAVFRKHVEGMLEEEKRLHRIKAEGSEFRSRDSERQQDDIVRIVKDVALKQRECEAAFAEITRDHRSLKANLG